MIPRARLEASWLRVTLARVRNGWRTVVAIGRLLYEPAANLVCAAGVFFAFVIVPAGIIAYLASPAKKAATNYVEKSMPSPDIVNMLVDEYVHNDPRFERSLKVVVENFGAENLMCALQAEVGAP